MPPALRGPVRHLIKGKRMTLEPSSADRPAPTHLRGVLSIAAAAVAWGTGGAVAVTLQRHDNLGPVTVSFWRFVVAVAALAVVRSATRRSSATSRSSATRRSSATSVSSAAQRSTTSRRVQFSTAIVGGLGLAVSQAAYFGSADSAGVALATLVTMGTCPVLIALGARYLLGERLTYRRFTAIGLALVGLVLLTVGPHTGGSDPTLGILLALLSAATYSAVILQGRARQGQGEMLPAYVVGMLALAPIAIVQGAFPHGGNVFGAIGWLVYLGLVPTVLAYRWFFAGLATVPAATASVIALLESATAAAIAVGLLGEHLSPASLAGMAVLLIAVTFMARSGSAIGGGPAAGDDSAETGDGGRAVDLSAAGPIGGGLGVPLDRAASALVDQASGVPGERASGVPGERASGVPVERASGVPVERAGGVPVERAGGVPVERAGGVSAD
jgi:drug/metabolite transporter, DME family